MDRFVCWNNAEKTYNPFSHHCFVRVIQCRLDPYEGTDFQKIGENRWNRAIFGKIGKLCFNDVIFSLTVIETLQKFFKLSNTPNGQVYMLE